MEVSSFLTLLTIVSAITIGANSLAHRGQEAQMRQWQSLARAKKLTFTPGKWSLFNSSSALVQGTYHNCHLLLTTVQRKHGKSRVTYTQVSVWPEQRRIGKVDPNKFPLGQKLAYHDLNTWLNGQLSLYFYDKLPIKVEAEGLNFVYEERDVVADHNFLERLFDFLAELTLTYPEVLALGGDAVPALQEITSDSPEALLQPVAQQLLRDIANDTVRRLHQGSKKLICPNCLTYCASYDLRLGWWSSLTFYVCRTCRQSREFLQGSLIAVLDSQDETELIKEQDNLRVNWLQRRTLFDFNRIEIIQATDEDVERFAVQVGNDTDEWRKPRYEQMSCDVSTQCQLSENTLRILERMFGEVRVE